MLIGNTDNFLDLDDFNDFLNFNFRGPSIASTTPIVLLSMSKRDKEAEAAKRKTLIDRCDKNIILIIYFPSCWILVLLQ